MNVADMLIILFILGLIILWAISKKKNKNTEKTSRSKCRNCANLGFCGKNKSERTKDE